MKILKILLWLLIIGIVIILIILHIGASYVRASDASIREYFAEKSMPIDIKHQVYDADPIRYIQAGQEDASIACIFIHGAPGSGADYKAYLAKKELADRYLLIAPDRLGYGYSHYGSAATIEEQVAYLDYLISELPQDSVYLVSHSYGCAIAGSLAVTNAKVMGHLMMGAVIDPDAEPMFWYARPSYWKATRWLLPKYLQVAGIEKRDHVAELREIDPQWKNTSVPTYMLHGPTDWLAPAEANIAFAKNHIPEQLLTISMREDKSHFIPFNDEDYVLDMIIKMIKED